MQVSRTAEANADLAARIGSCRRLPTLPAVALRLIHLAEDPGTTIQQFADLIATDPALAGKLVRVANSSLYGLPRTVSSLSQAINLLGMNATIALALSFSLCRPGTTHCSEMFDASRYWRRSLLTALAASTVAVELQEPQPGDFLLAGLLQDIGVLVMDVLLGEGYSALHSARAGHDELLRQERESFGFTHVDAGDILLHQWQLPNRIADSIRSSHEFTPQAAARGGSQAQRLPVVVAVASRIADGWLAGARPEDFAPARDQAQVLLAMAAACFHRVLAAMAVQVPEMEQLFKTRLVDLSVIDDVETSAREILAMRNVSLAKGVAEREYQVEALERRAATLEGRAQRDPLTGLYNRAYLELALGRVYLHSVHARRPLSVAFIDIDRFKAVNDGFGHVAGDEVLVGVTRLLLAGVRKTDIVARYGGEEFVVVLPDTPVGGARVVMERILAAVCDAPILTSDGTGISVTFSAGIATLHGDTGVFESTGDLLKAADRALYEAKRAGRARVVAVDADMCNA
ncbi:MAG TPA: GGDEF domain-containing protein [Nevskiaceae bacterium]